MKLLDNPMYVAVREAFSERKEIFASFKIEDFGNLKDGNQKLISDQIPENKDWTYQQEWEQALNTFNFDSKFQRPVIFITHSNLVESHKHISGNTFQRIMDLLEYLQCTSEDADKNDEFTNLVQNKFKFEDMAGLFVDNILSTPASDKGLEPTSNELSSYDRIYHATFYMDVLGNVLKSDNSDINNGNAFYIDKTKQIAENNIKIANTLYDFAENLADKLGIPVKEKTQKKPSPL